MITLDFNKGVHPDCGKKFYVHNDIIVTPFWTEEFCKSIIELANQQADNFSKEIVWYGESSKAMGLGWDDIKFDSISQELFQEFVKQYKERIVPLLSQVYTPAAADIKGWFSPYIIRYTQIGQYADLHNDASYITLNVKLNNDYTGCDLVFPRQDFDSKDIPVGHAMIWPSTVSHPHYSTPLEKGSKFSIISWTWPPEWNKQGIENI